MKPLDERVPRRTPARGRAERSVGWAPRSGRTRRRVDGRRLASATLALALAAGAPAGAQLCAHVAYVPNFSAGTVSIVDTGTNTVVATVPVGAWPLGVAVHPDGSSAWISNEFDDTVSVIDSVTLAASATIAVGDRPTGIAMHPTGTVVFVANAGSQSLSVVSTSSKTVLATVPLSGAPYGVAVAVNGDRVYVTDASNDTLAVVDPQSLTVVDTVAVGKFPDSVAVDPLGDLVFVGNHEGNSVSVIERATNQVIATVPVGSHPHDVAVHPDGTHIYVANDLSHTVSVIERDTWVEQASVPVLNPQAITAHPEGDRVYVSSYTTDELLVIDTATHAITDTIQVGNGPWGLGEFIGCDRDVDRDGCWNDVDQHPESSVARSGRVIPGPGCPSGVAQDKVAYEGTPLDTDGDGVYNCADFDDDNDGLCDDDETLPADAPGISPLHEGCVGPDPCPLHPGELHVACQEIAICPEMPPWWVNCQFLGAGCFEFLVKIDSLINPDPTAVFELLEIVDRTLYVRVAAGMTVPQAADLLLGAGVPGGASGEDASPKVETLRLELWKKSDGEQKERFVALVAEYRAEDVEIGTLEGGRVLAIQPLGAVRPTVETPGDGAPSVDVATALWVNAVRAPGAPPMCVLRPAATGTGVEAVPPAEAPASCFVERAAAPDR